jgi:CRISPR type I-E-associated protein CasB/Cse2
MSEPAAAEALVTDGPPTFEQQLARVAGYVAKLPRGPRAILRRLRQHPDQVPPDIFWTIVGKYGIEPREEDFWLAVLPLMVEHEHQPGRRPGKALYFSGVKPARLERWLRYDAVRAREEAFRLLARVDGGFDWVQFGLLLRWWDEGRQRRLARDFFLTGGDEAAGGEG